MTDRQPAGTQRSRGTEDSGAPGEETEPARPVESAAENPSRREEFDWRGWVLVAAVVVSFLVVPAAILYLPRVQGFIASLGLSWTQAYVVLPMVPAVLLGATAIWVAVSSRRADSSG